MATFQQWKPSQYTNMNETKKAHVDSGFEARGGDRQTYKTLGSALNPSSPRHTSLKLGKRSKKFAKKFTYIAIALTIHPNITFKLFKKYF